MKPVVVSDAGPLIALAKLDLLRLLPELFSTVYVPEVVVKEATRQCERKDARDITVFARQFLNIRGDIDNAFCRSLRVLLDEGEVQALASAQELKCGVFMDEKRGRQVAIHHQIPVIGVIGLLIQAKQKQLIADVKTPLQALIRAEYRLSGDLLQRALNLAGESGP